MLQLLANLATNNAASHALFVRKRVLPPVLAALRSVASAGEVKRAAVALALAVAQSAEGRAELAELEFLSALVPVVRSNKCCPRQPRTPASLRPVLRKAAAASRACNAAAGAREELNCVAATLAVAMLAGNREHGHMLQAIQVVPKAPPPPTPLFPTVPPTVARRSSLRPSPPPVAPAPKAAAL